MTVYGVDVTSVLAGLGIVGVVLGFALQDLAKDIIAGFSIIFENQYAIGDTISINGFKGEVIFLGLKTTKIKNYEAILNCLEAGEDAYTERKTQTYEILKDWKQ